MNNYEKIKQMSVDEMAEWLTTMVNFDCHDCNTLERCDDCFEINKQWLESEVRE